MLLRVTFVGILLGSLALLFGASVRAKPASPGLAASASRGLIVYKCDGGALCMVRPDGSGSRTLLATGRSRPWPQWDPAVSPDGRVVAFRGYYGLGDGQYALYTVAMNGCSTPHRLTRSVGGAPSWSPDGKWIAFDTSGEGVIWKVHPDGTGLTRIVESTGADYDTSPAWSPNGRTIAFIHFHRGRGQIWVIAADGGRPRLVHADPDGSDDWPVWSHDGSKIVFAFQAGRGSSIAVINASGGKRRALTSKATNAWNPAWLPNDAAIAYLVESKGTGRFFVMRPDGSDAHLLMARKTEQFSWSDVRLPPRRC